MKRSLITAGIAVAVLGGCASTPEFTPPPPEMLIQPEPLPEPEPVMLARKPAPRGRYGKGTKVNATTVFEYSENQVYPVSVAERFMLSIYLAPGEELVGSAAVGDPSKTRWRAYSTRSGNQAVVLLQAGPDATSTNVVIPGSIRTYQLVATKVDRTVMDIVRWDDPPAAPKKQRASVVSCDPTMVNTSYKVTVESGEVPAWFPVGAYDCGTGRTWIKFPTTPTPLLYVEDSPLMPAISGNFYIIPRAISVATLRQNGTTVSIRKM